ncbi:Phage head morphogenesis domain containing protein [uncultured Caudovirales phage]|uniref:Phage head morphogenesis domain containing protein n=1 Tax=uncultured Caudovirales phage TaxID=2100421 RepID=A0A6J5RIH9_9CAUD|nr:Phage head morphogenesis domain containing protein [uncultured Caudovirales phage]
MPSGGPLPSYLFNVDYIDIMSRVERRVRSRIRRGIVAMFTDYSTDSELGDIIADLRSGAITTATLYNSFDAIVNQSSLMDEPVRQALDSAGMSVMRIAGRDAGEALDRWAQRSTTTTPNVATDVRFDPSDVTLVSDLRRSGDLFWSQLMQDTIKATKDEIERSYYNNDSAAAMADRLQMVSGLTTKQAESLDRVRKTLAKGPLTPVQRDKILRESADRMLAYRSESITHTELNRIVNSGAKSYWDQMARRGMLDYNTTLVRWNTHPDEKLCPVCAPLDGTYTVINGQFDSGVVSPPLHPHCRCSLELEYKVAPLVRIMKGDKDADGDGWVDDGLPTQRPAKPKVPKKVKTITLYHGTKEKNVAGIRERGLTAPAATGSKWFMLTTSLDQARRYSLDGVVIEYKVPVNRIYGFLRNDESAPGDLLWPAWKHDSYDFDADAYALRQPLPGEFISRVITSTPEAKSKPSKSIPVSFGRSEKEISASIGVDEDHLYRVISEADYQRITREGAINTDGRGNIDLSEGTVAARGRIAWSYLGDIANKGKKDNPTNQGRVVKIRIDPKDGWKQDRDGYWKTNQPVGSDRIVGVSMPIGVKRTDDSIEYDWSEAPVKIGNSIDAIPGYDGEVPDENGGGDRYWEWKKKAEKAYGGTVRGNPISWDDERVPPVVYHVTTHLRSINQSGVIRAAGEGGLGGDSSDRIVSMTTSKEVADDLVADMRMMRDITMRDMAGDDLVSYLKKSAKDDGVSISDRKWNEIDYYTKQGRAAVITAYLSARESSGGRRNPLFFGLEKMLDAMSERIRIDASDVGIVEIPRANLNTGAQLTDFDLGQNFLDEIRLYGDLPIAGTKVIS